MEGAINQNLRSLKSAQCVYLQKASTGQCVCMLFDVVFLTELHVSVLECV